MHRDRITQAAWFVAACLAVAGCGFLLGPIGRARMAIYPGVGDQQWRRSVSPDVAIAMAALGPFRGLGVDYLWYRAVSLQQEGKYFEANQLSQWITMLQPRSPQVWAFHAWNMAYNISVATHTPEERWDWVTKGIALLRDRGIVYNPTATRLYRELAWIYFHKIGQFSDDMHWYYKRKHAELWDALLGAPPPGAATPAVIAAFRPVADAPESAAELAREHPGAAALLAKLHDLGHTEPEPLLRRIGAVLADTGPAPLADEPPPDAGGEPPEDAALAECVRSADPQARDQLLAYLRKRVLRENYHMDPAFMLHLMELYGPLDWRHPAAHGCYWAETGVKMAGEPGDPGTIDLLNTNRQSIHALQELAWFGYVSFDARTGQYDLMPDPRFIPAYDRAMDLARQRMARGDYGPGVAESFAKGHENFLLRAMSDQYLYGDTAEAQRLYEKVRRLYGQNSPNGYAERYHKPLVELVTEELSQQLDTPAVAEQMIVATLVRAFDHGLAQNRMDVFDRFVRVARDVHRRYQQGKRPRGTTTRARIGMLPFDDAVADAFTYYMQAPNVPLIKKVSVWGHAPPTLTARVSDQLLPILHAQAEEAGLDPDRAFPAPPAAARSPLAPRGSPSADVPTPLGPTPTIERQ